MAKKRHGGLGRGLDALIPMAGINRSYRNFPAAARSRQEIFIMRILTRVSLIRKHRPDSRTGSFHPDSRTEKRCLELMPEDRHHQ